jgi:hypothetical protein
MKVDKLAPAVSAAPSRAADANGWYDHALAVSFAGTDATSGVESCSPPQTYSGPDSAGTAVADSCRDRAGNSREGPFGLKYDASAPDVTEAVAVRPPDRGGWYNRPVAFSFQGRDATSGIESCGAASYDGPDAASARVTGSCSDKAGKHPQRDVPAPVRRHRTDRGGEPKPRP